MVSDRKAGDTAQCSRKPRYLAQSARFRKGL